MYRSRTVPDAGNKGNCNRSAGSENSCRNVQDVELICRTSDLAVSSTRDEHDRHEPISYDKKCRPNRLSQSKAARCCKSDKQLAPEELACQLLRSLKGGRVLLWSGPVPYRLATLQVMPTSSWAFILVPSSGATGGSGGLAIDSGGFISLCFLMSV